jgi:3-phenylpropionate/cinnamic acid dioxygenase small subunit
MIVSEEDGIRRTLAQHAQLCDDGRFDEWADLYAKDASFSVMGQTYKGRDAIKHWIEKVQPAEHRGKHVLINPVIDVDGGEAHVVTDYIFIAKDKTIASAGRYHDRLVKEPDRWRFAERGIVFMGDEA